VQGTWFACPIDVLRDYTCRRGRRTKVKELSFEAWLEIKANPWTAFTTKECKEIRGTSRLAYFRCKDGYVQPTRKGFHAIWDEHENRFALNVLDCMGQAGG
jgi:hypothetical protein